MPGTPGMTLTMCSGITAGPRRAALKSGEVFWLGRARIAAAQEFNADRSGAGRSGADNCFSLPNAAPRCGGSFLAWPARPSCSPCSRPTHSVTPHALDRGGAVAAGVLRLLGTDMPVPAQAWRAAWEEAGVVCDPVHGRFKIVLRPALAVPGWCDVPLCRDLVSVPGS
jgi:Protein of unknown function N-terminus (DUF3323)